MENSEMCKAVAIEVMGWEPKYLNNVGEVFKSNRTPHELPLVFSWQDAGKVIETLRTREWKFSSSCESTGQWRTIFWPSGEEFMSLEDTTLADTFPEAVFKAALKAVRSK